MSAKSLLDFVSYKGTHTHIHPIVLVERLEQGKKEKVAVNKKAPDGNKKTADARKRAPDAKKKLPKAHNHNTLPKQDQYQKKHDMKLRSRKTKLAEVLTKAAITKLGKQKPTHTRQQKFKNAIAKRAKTKTPAKKISPTPTKKVKVVAEKNPTLRRSRESDYDFTIDDHMPLNVLKKMQEPVTPMGPPAAPPAPPAPAPAHEHSVEPSCSAECKSPSAVSFYSEQGIRRWMEGSIPEPSTPQIAAPSGEQESDLDAATCPAAAWRCLNDVMQATQAAFDARCLVCNTCEGVEKLMLITKFLKKLRKIDFTDEAGWGVRQATTKNNMYNETCLISELLPKHPHVMLRIVIIEGPIVSYTTFLIPRAHATVTHDLIFEHQSVLNEVLETLSLSLGEPPSNLVRPVSPVAECSEVRSVSPVAGCSGVRSVSPVAGCSGVRPVSPVAGCSGLNTGASIPELDPLEDKMGSDFVNTNLLDAPVFRPTQEEFTDPIAYIEKIWDQVEPYGICKIIPPADFTPPCKNKEEIRFNTRYQYISRLYNRWGPAARETSAINACDRAQSKKDDYIMNIPLIDGLEVSLPNLYHIVQRHGGLQNVIDRNKWGKVAEDMRLSKAGASKLEGLYLKHVLAYDTLSAAERQDLLHNVDRAWSVRHIKLLERSKNPYERLEQVFVDLKHTGELVQVMNEAEDCVRPGVSMLLPKFKKMAKAAFEKYFDESATIKQIEEAYWARVTGGLEHVCVSTAAVDTGELGHGFPKGRGDPYARHPWNLKMLSKNPANLLRSLGPALGVTSPSLQVGMVFSTSCLHRDPHELPWVEYSHQGPPKIWYGVPARLEGALRAVMETLNPTVVQHKALWLPSDVAMVPPALLRERGVAVFRAEQRAGEFVLVLPRAHASALCTGYTITESVYFATERWLDVVAPVFEEMRICCEPSMLSLEQLLQAIAEDSRASITVLKKIQPILTKLINDEIAHRAEAIKMGIRMVRRDDTSKGWNMEDSGECRHCRCTTYLSELRNLPLPDAVMCAEHAVYTLSRPEYAYLVEISPLYYSMDNDDLLTILSKLEWRVDDAMEQ